MNYMERYEFWCNAGLLFELANEITLGCIVQNTGHLTAAFSLTQEFLGFIDPDFLDVIADRHTHMFSEQFCDVFFGIFRMLQIIKYLMQY